VGGLDDAEVSPVESGHPVYAEAFGHRDDGGVDPAEWEVGVLEDQLAHPGQVGRGEVDQFEGSAGTRPRPWASAPAASTPRS
jgi:hypothetical protein